LSDWAPKVSRRYSFVLAGFNNDGRSTAPASKTLELTAEIITQSYCSVNPDAASLELKLKLRYRNVGKQKIILYNGHDLFYQTKIHRVAVGFSANTLSGPAPQFTGSVQMIDSWRRR
jgi:hypothetical protein